MGIKGLFPYLQEVAPKSIKDSDLKRYTGQALAIDASAWMYQFLSIVRTGAAAENLQNKQGEATSHLQGFLLRAVKLLEAGVQPVFVFDGKPPDMKLAVNKARREVRAAAAEEHAAAVASETASAEEVYKAASRSTMVTRAHNDSAKELLRVMGLPVIEAPGEAEAACAQLCRAGEVYGSVTEDMDVLTFGSPRQIKNLFDVEGSRSRQGPRPAREIDLDLVLEGLSCSMDRFIEFCILAGCDYLPHLPKIGAKTAFQLLEREGSLQAVVEAISAGKGPKGCSLPESWDWASAKQLFLTGPTELQEPTNLTFAPPDLAGLRSLLIERHQFSEARVDSVLGRLRKAREPGGAAHQRRLDAFFKPSSVPSTPGRAVEHAAATGPEQTQVKRRRLETAGKDAGVEDLDVVCPSEGGSRSSAASVQTHSGRAMVPWSCSKCTFANDPQLPYCEMCETPRSSEVEDARVDSCEVTPKTGCTINKSFTQLKSSEGPQVAAIDLDD